MDGQNQCLKAAQDCGLYEKCGSLRSDYVVACTKRPAASDSSCNRQKCHRALRRFLERVPEEYSFALLFCPCSDPLCGERRRKTIVPSCSYEENGRGEERVGKPNCLSLQNYCSRDELCRYGSSSDGLLNPKDLAIRRWGGAQTTAAFPDDCLLFNA